MSKENLIHVRFGREEAFQAKRDILSSEMVLLRIAKMIKGYSFYRSQELELKSILYKEMKELKMNLGKLQRTLPKIKIPTILKGEFQGESEGKTESKPKKTKPVERGLEEQLQEIQRRLSELQQRRV